MVLLGVEGVLEEGDRILPTDNSLYDEHSFEGQQEQPVIITLESEDFDPYLVLVSPDSALHYPHCSSLKYRLSHRILSPES